MTNRDVPTFLVEVLRRDTAASAIVATGMDAFGDQPRPTAQRGVFAFRHDWGEPLIERVEWQTGVVRLAGGNESRQARRSVPRRWITYNVGNASSGDALVADWLVDHLGRLALWPLPQYGAHLVQDAPRGALNLQVSGDWLSHFMPSEYRPKLGLTGVDWNQTYWTPPNPEYLVIVMSHEGWQVARLRQIVNNTLTLIEPLSRSARAGSLVMNLVDGYADDACDFALAIPGVAEGSVTAEVVLARGPETQTGDPLLDGIPVWPDGNWRDDPTASAQGVITRQDFSTAMPWLRRDDPWSATTYKRRYLASGKNAIERWRARLWQTQGRLRPFWLPDGLAPVLWVAVDADPEDGFLRVDGKEISAFWHRPAACMIVHPDGTRQYALTAACYLDQGGVLVLRSGLGARVPKSSRVIRLARCRLDHDAIDLYWHSPQVMEISLTARHLPEPRGANSGT